MTARYALRANPRREFHWDVERWHPREALRRRWAWIRATRRRRWIFWTSLLFTALVVIPMTVGAIAIATAQTTTTTVVPVTVPGNPGVSWTGVRDSSGVPLADYMFLTNNGSLLHPGNTALSVILNCEFAGFQVIDTTAIWWISYVLSFNWLTLLDKPLTSVGNTLTQMIATPVALTVGATVGGLFVAWFVVRGLYAKAATQTVAMLLIAMLGITFLSAPLADVLSPNGILAQARDAGISVAAGINGENSPSPDNVINTMEGTMADNLVRHPLQDWDLGAVADDVGTCKAAWSAGSMSGNETTMLNELNSCGDSAGAGYAESPSAGQIGTGLILIITSTILLVFAGFLGGRIFVSALGSVYSAFRLIFLFAMLGFIYGPFQTSLVRTVIGVFTDAFAMMVYVIYLGVYVLVLNDLFTTMPNGGY